MNNMNSLFEQNNSSCMSRKALFEDVKMKQWKIP